MLFSSFIFIFGFLPVALIGFYAVARTGRSVAAIWLIVASFVFYGWWNPAFVVLLLISIAGNYTISITIGAAEARPRLQKAILTAGIGLNLIALCYYKYLASVLQFLHAHSHAIPDMDTIVLPLGISFFTFTQIGYLVDCHAGRAKERGPLNYVLFVTFFPHLIAGPILHNRDIMPQFAESATYRFSSTNLAVGLTIFVMGLLKKVMLADPLSTWVAAGYAYPAELTGIEAWNTALCYSLQLYFDFSGYSDMAIGLARTMNIRFPLNFNSPYKSRSVIEYWQRWHISLTQFLTQYIFTPVARAAIRRRRANKLPINFEAQKTLAGFWQMIAFPILLTITLAGVWHGSGLQFVVFGLLHGAFLCINHLWRLLSPTGGMIPKRHIVRWGQTALTYVCVLVASVFFRAPSVPAALDLLAGMAGLHGHGSLPIGDQIASAGGTTHVLWLAVLYTIVWSMPNTQQIMVRTKPAIGDIEAPAWRRFVWWPGVPSAIAIGIGAALAIVALGGTSEFLYFQF